MCTGERPPSNPHQPRPSNPHPSSCSEKNVVYFNTNGTYLKLAGGSSGCGLLLVDGDLNIDGGFSWYGVILVSGSVDFTGGGNKNVTGAILAGGMVQQDVVGGNANIVNCSTAIASETNNFPLIMQRWLEVFN